MLGGFAGYAMGVLFGYTVCFGWYDAGAMGVLVVILRIVSEGLPLLFLKHTECTPQEESV